MTRLHCARMAIFISLASALLFPEPVRASSALAKQNTCSGCHAPDRKVVGPSYKAIAAKYQNQPQAPVITHLSNKIRVGGGGVWGVVVMPGNSKISEADAKTLAKWILDGAP
ncbi:MAG: cytochrome C' [Polynucleobacter sp.]|nr:cytochrome C' [Polynucleobacter sp.]MDZ4058041.1 cytochrome C' [Polynucleobacter sp.]